MLILLAALSRGPKIVMYGLTAVFSKVCPIPFINNANRNIGKLIHLAAGTIISIPKAINKNDKNMDLLYPTFIRIFPDGIPKSTNAEKVAVVTKYDFAVLIWNADFTKGTKNALIPTAKPNTENIIPITIMGRIKLFHFPNPF